MTKKLPRWLDCLRFASFAVFAVCALSPHDSNYNSYVGLAAFLIGVFCGGFAWGWYRRGKDDAK